MILNKFLIFIYIICTPLHIYCEIVTMYKEDKTYTDKLCAKEYLELELFVPSPLSCLIACLNSNSSSSSIYHRNNSTCYCISDGYHGNCTRDLPGAKMYKKEAAKVCPDGWRFIYKSCYKYIEERMSRDDSMIACQNDSVSAHLADLQTKAERENLQQAIQDDTLGLIKDSIWLGGRTYGEDFIWSDNTTAVETELPGDINYSLMFQGKAMCQAIGLCAENGEYCITAYINVSSWNVVACKGALLVFTFGGLCELDI